MYIIQHNKVTNPPSFDLIVWDGSCPFCRYWIERFRDFTDGRVSDAPFQRAAAKFPEIKEEEFRETVKLIDSEGTVYSGAAAALKALQSAERFPFLWNLYINNPLFRKACNLIYTTVSRNRPIAYKATRLLWGNDPASPRPYWIFYISVLVIAIALWKRNSSRHLDFPSHVPKSK